MKWGYLVCRTFFNPAGTALVYSTYLGGTDCGSAHKPILASRASFSSPSSMYPRLFDEHGLT
jgi:hypothetical protein